MLEEQARVATDDTPVDFAQLVETERLWIGKRREAHGIGAQAPVAGLALSGGGIRSATFSLGFLQGLSASGMLRTFDYLSTVSGGSYIGSALGALFVPAEGRGGSPDTPRPAFEPARPWQSPRGEEAVRRLRDSGRYLTPAGTSDAFFGAAIVVRNWAAVQLTIGMAVLLLFQALNVSDRMIFHTPFEAGPSLTLGWMIGAISILVFASSLAYWLTRREWIPGSRLFRIIGNPFFWAVFCCCAYALGCWFRPAGWAGWFAAWGATPAAIAGISGSAILLHLWAEWRRGAVRFTVPSKDSTPQEQLLQRHRDLHNPQLLIPAEDRVRSFHSNVLGAALAWVLGLAILLLIDWLGSWLPFQIGLFAKAVQAHKVWPAVYQAWPAIIAIVPPLLSWLGSRRLKTVGTLAPEPRRGSWVPSLLLVGGILLLGAWMTLWSAIAHYADGKFATNQTRLIVLAVLFAINLVASLSYSFINLSSLATFYTSRLRRAYIGASSYGTPFTSVKEDDPEDAIRLESYYRFGLAAGAPLHLINVTVAETVPSGSNLVARDRKGKPMQLSPAGIAYEGDRPGEVIARGRRWGEELPLANWVAISGAAVSAAIGSGTSLGTSILATMVNTRLGYWWKQNRARSSVIFWSNWRDTVQNHLLAELRGAFRGTRNPRWYLTDGGHFENTGAYTLLQRELPFIVVSDNGADPDYRMEDLVRLVSRARTDLGVQIEFLQGAELAQKLGAGSSLARTIGPLSGLVKGSRTDSGGPIAALARVGYRSGATGLLLLVKPRLTFLEPPEVLAYEAGPGCADFPQQTTGDQFFDEAQWEAYRRLGELAAEALFPPVRPDDAVWAPVDELALPA